MDELDQRFQGLDAARPLPAGMRQRLSEAIVDLATAPTGVPTDATERTGVPTDATERTAAPALAGLDAPRPLPPYLRARLHRDLARTRFPVRWLAVAAAVILVAGGTTLALRPGGGSGPQHHNVAAAPAVPSTIVAAGGSAQSGAPSFAAGSSASQSGTGSASAGAGGASGGPAGGAAAPVAPSSVASGGNGPPPPYTFGPPQAESLPAAAPAPRQADTHLPPLPVTVVGDNAGFDRYIELLNSQGGINGRDLAPTTQAGGVATVNLSDQPLPSQPGLVLETTYLPDALLRSDVFDVVSSPVHQAVALVDAMQWKPGQIVGIYRGAPGVWAAEVPNAMAAAVRAHGATPVVMTYAVGHLAPPPSVALLALDTRDATAFAQEAASRGYHPAIAGIGTLAETNAENALPNGTRILAPFSMSNGTELSAIGPAAGTADIHGWLTAKILAVALWRSGATTPTAAAAALHQMSGYADGFDPPLAWRTGTNSLIADGIVYTISNHTLAGGGAFVRDPS